MINQIELQTRLVGDISGEFYVPSYQRGYRWGTKEVERLLSDLFENGTANYCLQPIVVCNHDDTYELIDGQQRLTTLFLIYKYMHQESMGFIPDAKFTLEYETRKKSAEFLQNIDISQQDDNIDYWFICNAYKTIGRWFSDKGDKKTSVITNINKYFDENVSVIWYEVGDEEDVTAMFARLNIGKIPLTSSELVKAMFLSKSDESMTYERQHEISMQWDSIEKELHNPSLWGFLTNRSGIEYQTRIDLLLDLISGHDINSKDKYETFFFFANERETSSLQDLWSLIQKSYLIVRDWYDNHDLYHKIGYLIASGTASLGQIYVFSRGKKKSEFISFLDALIKESIKLDYGRNYADLSYEDGRDRRAISKLLLLFNVESVRKLDEKSQRFAFDKFKENDAWSLEHIHAQSSEGMKTSEAWIKWLELHIPSVQAVDDQNKHNELVYEMMKAVRRARIDRAEFERLQKKVLLILSSDSSVDLHSISNLALLKTNDNAALNNSTFDVKRNEIIKLDKNGSFIPFCTKMAFLKYYTDSKDNQIHFWGPNDRASYIEAINETLSEYLSSPIYVKREE